MQHSFAKFVGAALIIVGFASASFAQDNDNIIRPLTKSGSAAFLFTLGGFGTFGIAAPVIGTVNSGSGANSLSATAAGAGMKYFISDDMALRILVSLGTSSSGTSSTSTSKLSSTVFGVGAGLEMHFRPLYSTSPFAGVQIGYASGSQTRTSQAVAGTDQEIKATGSQFNAAVFAGFDWFFTRGIAIGAQYQLGFASNSSSTTVPNGSSTTTTDAPSSTAIGIGLASGASVHAVVYF